MFKIFGVIMIIFSTTYIGFLKASTYKNRILELTEFQKGFELFETEVRFTKSPLCTAFLNISKNLSGNVSLIFKQFSEEYLDTNGESASEIWETVYEVVREVINSKLIDETKIKALGITNQRETTVIWNKETGEPIYNAIVWQSRQSQDICEDLIKNGYEELIKDKTGLIILVAVSTAVELLIKPFSADSTDSNQ